MARVAHPQLFLLPEDLPEEREDRLIVLDKIHAVMIELTTSLADGSPPTLTGIKRRSGGNMSLVLDDSNGTVRLMSSNANLDANKSLKSMTSVLLVMQYSARLLRANKTCTQRELYYVFQSHFQIQKQCDGAILDCASLLGVDRERLNLRASSRGLYGGCIRLWEPGLGYVDGTMVRDALSISSHWITNPAMTVDVTNARFILVVEKEGIFGRLFEDKFWRRLPCIIITGRGYPDLATRAMVHQLSKRFNLPCFGLADCNPFGLALLLTYKLGSVRMGSKFICDLKWVGLRPSQLDQLSLPSEVMQPLTDRDRSRIDSLMTLLQTSEEPFAKAYCDELQLIKTKQKKCELEALVSRAYDLSLISTLSDYLERQITQRKYI